MTDFHRSRQPFSMASEAKMTLQSQPDLAVQSWIQAPMAMWHQNLQINVHHILWSNIPIYYSDRRTCVENALSMLALLAQPVSAVQQIACFFLHIHVFTCFLGLQLTDQHGWLFKLRVCEFAHQHHASSYTWSKLQENHKHNLGSCEPVSHKPFLISFWTRTTW